MSDQAQLNTDGETKEQLDKRVADALNRHGYAFQHAVIRQAEHACMRDPQHWQFLATEFPVTVNGKDTRIDIIFGAPSTDLWMIAECKRVNPAYSDWCFFKSSYIARGQRVDFIATCVRYKPMIFHSGGVTIAYNTGQNYYNVGFAVKAGKKGDPIGGADRAIEEAATQVMVGVNGMADFLKVHDSLLVLAPTGRRAAERVLIPVLFTTARLLASEADISEADVRSGTVDPKKMGLVEKPYLYYHYPVSPGLRHGMPSFHSFKDIPSILLADHLRTIAVVNASRIAEFFSEFHPLNIHVLRV